MARRMLIDTAHSEETRVVVVNGNRIEEFDFEAAAKKPLKGNIYLAKVTRVEPSLQAAFVDYGGNRHGFLAFSEIHPDYYQIPVADRQVLVAAQTSEARAAAREDDRLAGDLELSSTAAQDTPDGNVSEKDAGDDSSVEVTASEGDAEDIPAPQASAEDESLLGAGENGPQDRAEDDTSSDTGDTPAAEPPASTVETAGADDLDDALEEARGRRALPYGRPYKIQEVIKRRQILLVQVVKEERGNKGAALTTYLSLAGRYCVLMPNTARGGGISRKITNQTDRKRLKSAAAELEIPAGMGLIVRTAGANRTKAEIKRDYEYLLRAWETVRDLTLKSTAPALVYEEGKLIKRAIRDLYSKEIDAILVDGEEGYKEAKSFMRTLMPSHAKAVQHYKDRVPLFQRFQIESLLDQMFNPVVTLRSGGYLVINQTEALVSIDVNSGRSTREHSIEDTATRTNLEAAEEVARQLRLRDLAGLIVIDFIDIEDGRNNRAVEKRLKDALKHDRARIQIGRISSFGLLEMSRQRLRAGVLEGSTHRCPHCEGRGVVRSVESASLRALRAMEEEGLKDRTAQMTVRLPTAVALYILNHKRADLVAVEERYACTCVIEADDTLPAAGLVVERTVTREAQAAVDPASTAVRYDITIDLSDDEEDADPERMEVEAEAEADDAETTDERAGEGRSDDSRRKRRRRRRRGGRGRDDVAAEARDDRPAPDATATSETDEDDTGENEDSDVESGVSAGDGSDDPSRRRRRRGRRGGRRNRRRDGSGPLEHTDAENHDEASESLAATADSPAFAADEVESDPMPVSFEIVPEDLSAAQDGDPYRAATGESDTGDESEDVPAVFEEPASPPNEAPALVAVSVEEDSRDTSDVEPVSHNDTGSANTPARKGWWQRRFGS